MVGVESSRKVKKFSEIAKSKDVDTSELLLIYLRVEVETVVELKGFEG